jgi:tryptophan 7-halogenase
MQQDIKQIIIVGGGSAGWLTAGIIAAKHCSSSETCINITLIESPDVAPIGVGEGTWPSMRGTLKKIGLSETEFIKECDASFKQASKFENWISGVNDSYYHPFTQPNGFFEVNIAKYWFDHKENVSFADATTFQSHLCGNGLAPKQITTPEYSFAANYGYHLDAGKFGSVLQKHCTTNLGVRHILDHVIDIQNSTDGYIASLTTKNNGVIEGDLFIDCTGVKSMLLSQHYNVGFNSVEHVLFNNKALAVHVPYKNENSPINSHTISNAQSSGWIWDIGLQSRRGVGHVYSDKHITNEKAQSELAQYIEKTSHVKADSLTIREISLTPGYRKEFWHKNCVAVGMSAGFIEPLEASALALIELSAHMIADQLPVNKTVMKVTAKRFNHKFTHRWERIIDFLKLHYVLSKREDSDYWLENRRKSAIPEHLQELLTLWKYQTPYTYDTYHTDELFPAASFQFVLYGMGYSTTLPNHMKLETEQAAQYFQQNAKQTHQLLNALNSNRQLLNKIKQYGLPKI